MTLRWPGANIQVTAISQYWHPTGIIGKHRLTRTDLVIVDDIGLLPVSADAAEGFYRLVYAAYEHKSLAVSSNLHPLGFDEIMPKTLSTATVDRLLHHARTS
jgi:DNA replication protein DnaC